jgi:hypothetical protein
MSRAQRPEQSFTADQPAPRRIAANADINLGDEICGHGSQLSVDSGQ